MIRHILTATSLLPLGNEKHDPDEHAAPVELRYQELVEFAHDGYLVTDLQGIILEANSAAALLLQTRREFLPGKPLPLFVGESHRSAIYTLLLGLRQGGSVRDWRVVFKPWASSTMEVLLSAAGIFDAEGHPAGLRWLLRDPRMLEERRQDATMQRLAAIGQAMVSLAHESRNLLQRSQACLERLSWRLKDQDEALDLVSRSRQAQHDLAHLLDDVRAYAAPVQLTLAPCDVREAWREAWNQVQITFPDRQAQLSEDACDTDPWCVADRFRLLQVFRNVLKNSFDACSGPVRVDIHCTEVDLAGRLALRITFRDHGPGIPPQQRPHLFEPFWTTRPHGTGLGLVISRRLVESHGGQVVVADRVPPGAEIIIILPRTGP
jgi:signal transduction histidine kinase